MTAAAIPAARANPAAGAQARDRWLIGVDARALIVVTAVLLSFGLATLYSASAFTAMQNGHASTFFLLKQLTGAVVGIVLFAIVAKIDAELWSKYAWYVMGLALLLMLVTVLPFTKGIAPPILGARRYLMGGSVQPSEFAKLAVILWTAMIVVKKGEQMRRLTKGLLPILVVVGALNVMAGLEPDFSTVLFYSLQMAIIAPVRCWPSF